jgi:hypothetical protein
MGAALLPRAAEQAYRLYHKKYAPTYGGEVSIALDGKWGIPYSDSPEGAAVQGGADWAFCGVPAGQAQPAARMQT